MAGYRPPLVEWPEQVCQGAPLVHESPFATIWFGPGAIDRITDLVASLDVRCPAILCTPDRAMDGRTICASLPVRSLLLPHAAMHSPADISDKVAAQARRDGADLLISIGGGSSIGLGKALVRRLALRHVTLPTTYAGSEMTPILGETRDGDKLTLRDDALRPSFVIYDPLLSRTLPAPIAAASGMNALAHAVEALTTSDDPDISWAGERAVRVLIDALPAIIRDPADPVARARALYGSWLAGYCLAEAPMALHHKLCHTLGGAFDMPHAQTHAAMLPHSFAFNAPACPGAVDLLDPLFGGDAAAGLFDLVHGLGLPTRLDALGLPEAGIGHVASLACRNPYANPRPFNEQDIAGLLYRAWRGHRPRIGEA